MPACMPTTDGATLALTRQLIELPSVTPADGGCQELMIERLRPLGFAVERLAFGDVQNFWARRGTAKPLFVFAGHTDVVPAGPLESWSSPPFAAEIRDGRLYGRGAADMKSSLAAMLVATRRFIASRGDHGGSIAFLVTSDEEGPAVDGTARVVEWLQARGIVIDHCLVGEPSSRRHVGDVVRVGRRGSLSAKLAVKGIQGHVAYPEEASNPIHGVLGPLADLAGREWDRGNAFFPPTSFQISNINAGTGASNVIPGELTAQFNFRFNTEQTADGLRAAAQAAFDASGAQTEITWAAPGQPFLTRPGRLTQAVLGAIREVVGLDAETSTGGGTSDGRFIAPAGAEVVELGPVNATIHKIDEHVAVADLEPLAQMYECILERLLEPASVQD